MGGGGVSGGIGGGGGWGKFEGDKEMKCCLGCCCFSGSKNVVHTYLLQCENIRSTHTRTHTRKTHSYMCYLHALLTTRDIIHITYLTPAKC